MSAPASAGSPRSGLSRRQTLAGGRNGLAGVTITDALEAGAQLDPTAFNTAVNRVTALRGGLF